MKLKSPFLMITTLLCVLFFTACQKEAGLLPQNSGSSLLVDPSPVDPIDNGILVPMAGNAYITKTAGSEAITNSGLTNWSNSNTIASTYFRVGIPGQLFIGFNASVSSGTSIIKVTINGRAYTVTDVTGSTYKRYRVGMINITSPGYVKVDLQGVSNTNNAVFANVSDIIIYGSSTLSNVAFANDAMHYSESRAGAGVRLEYSIPGNAEWFYNEMTVPTNTDKAGANYTSNGFTAGNAGMQLTASGEKRITFFVANSSVSDLAKIVSKGANVVENTVPGGKSVYLGYNWKAGTTYKFLTQAKADGSGNTSYSAWIYTPEDSQWKFIASCSRPNSGSYLTGLYSSIQGSSPDNGYFPRQLRCYNQWINTNGTWTEITDASFTGDATATNNQRLDYGASVSYSSFYLKSSGFFSDNLALNSSLKRTTTVGPPSVDLTNLP